MLTRFFVVVGAALGMASVGFGQTTPSAAERTMVPASAWRAAGDAAERTAPAPEKSAASTATPASTTAGSAAAKAASAPGVTGAAPGPRQPIAKVTSGNGTLPNERGQVWREYDISPYTTRVTATERPEQAIIDWILRETGYEAWHGEPLGILSATRRTLRVYHTPEMQAVVADLVDRFVGSEGETSTFGLRLVTLDSPNWRVRAQKVLRPVAVQTAGVSAWLLEKEEAVALLADLQRRSDYREHNSPHLLVNNGQATVVSAVRARPYIRDMVLRADTALGYEAALGQVDEGFSLDFGPLLSVDRKLIDATIKCDINQVEKMVPVIMEVPTAVAPRQRSKIEVPQMTHFRFHERFRWPVDKVLLVGMGMVAMPVPVDGKPVVAGLPLLGTTAARADLLVFVDCRGQTRQASSNARQPDREAKTYRGRY